MNDRRFSCASLLAAERWTVSRSRTSEQPRVCALVYPNSYHVGMSNLGFQTMRDIIDRVPGWACERAFSPDKRERLGDRPDPLPTFDGQIPLADCDVIAFSLSYELDFLNLVRVLRLAGLPPFAADRDGSHPLVCVGGACTVINIEPIADFVDLAVLGEGEQVFPEMLRAIDESGVRDRGDLLEALTQIDGVYVPSLYRVRYRPDNTIDGIQAVSTAPPFIHRRDVADIEAFDTATSILTPHTEFSNMRLVETSRGCPRRCRFCVVPTSFPGFRHRKRQTLLRLAEGFEKVGLLGAASSDHPEIEGIVTGLAARGHQVSISASRADVLTPPILAALATGGQRTLTVAPETALPEADRIVRKFIGLEKTLALCSAAQQAGIPNFKLYFLLGVPGTPTEEADAIVEFAAEVARAAPRGKITVSATPLVPKPHTPLQWLGMFPAEELEERVRRLERGIGRLRGRVAVKCESVKWSLIEALLSRGDRRLARVLHDLSAGPASYSRWVRTLAEHGLSLDFYTTRHYDTGEVLPWSLIETGYGSELVARDWKLVQELHNKLRIYADFR